jgi:hypothetical protein
MAIVYCTHNKINGKKYIGSHNGSNPSYLGSGTGFKLALKKHGKENFVREILWEGEEEFKLEMEEYWIKYFNAFSNLLFYNRSEKGVGCPLNTIKPPKTQEIKNKISISMLGKNTWSVGGHASKIVYQYNLQDDFIKEYPSVSEAMRQTNFKTIPLCVLGKISKSGGFKWSYNKM